MWNRDLYTQNMKAEADCWGGLLDSSVPLGAQWTSPRGQAFGVLCK